MNDDVPTVQLGDLTVFGKFPLPMMKALAVITTCLHEAYDDVSGFPPGTSKDKCLFTSLAVRDFLVRIGFPDATVRGVALYMAAIDRDDDLIHSIGVGMPGSFQLPGKFNGHAVCTVPSLNLLIDTTLYQAIRPAWAGAVRGMMAVEYGPPRPHQIIHGRPGIAGVQMKGDDRDVIIVWLDRPELNWRNSEDFRVRNHRRIGVTKALCEIYGQ